MSGTTPGPPSPPTIGGVPGAPVLAPGPLARSRLIVRLNPNVALPANDAFDPASPTLGIAALQSIVAANAGISFQLVFASLPPAELRQLVHRAQALDPTYAPPDFFRYLYVTTPPGQDPAAWVATLIAFSGKVDGAYVERPGDPPGVTPADEQKWLVQSYLHAAEDGIDSRAAWEFDDGFGGGDGAGLRLADVEMMHPLPHAELPPSKLSLVGVPGPVDASDADHATAVLGIVMAADAGPVVDGAGVDQSIVGAAPNLAEAMVVSDYVPPVPPSGTMPGVPGYFAPAAAIVLAAWKLAYGDVLLIELQNRVDVALAAGGSAELRCPVELDDACYEAVRLATALGIVVVEPGGNGDEAAAALDLDTFAVIKKSDAAFRDSLAIVVSAAEYDAFASAAPFNKRLPWAPYGTRVNCYARGVGVATCRSGGGAAVSKAVAETFAGTSAAAAIVAGAALQVQGIVAKRYGVRLGPRSMRDLLSNPAHGTAAKPEAGKPIGVMPDLRKILGVGLDTIPIPFLRDFVGDDGSPHAGGLVSRSPDIILRRAALASPHTPASYFGEGSGREDRDDFNENPLEGQSCVVYVRVQNRGGAPASNVLVDVYWSEPSTLVHVDPARKIGQAKLPAVPPFVLTVSDAIQWDGAKIPVTGHYCLVAILGTAADPPPLPAHFAAFDEFVAAVRSNPEFAWRNFDVVANEPSAADTGSGGTATGDAPGGEGGGTGDVALEFYAAGALDSERTMRLEVLAGLPPGSAVGLEAPTALVRRVSGLAARTVLDPVRRRAFLPVRPHGTTLVGEWLAPAKAREKLRLLVRIPKAARKHAYEIAVRQRWKDVEVGRVTWRLVPKSRLRGRG